MTRIINSASIIAGGQVFASVLNVSIASSTNNLVIQGIEGAVLIRITSTGNFAITGLVNPDPQSRQIIVFNAGLNNITLKNNDINSSAINRFLIGSDKLLQADEGVALVYDSVSQRWRSYGLNI